QQAKDGNIKDTPPIIFVPRNEDREKWDELTRMKTDVAAQVTARKETAKPEFEAWASQVAPATIAELVPVEGLTLDAPLNEGEGRGVHVKVAGQPRELSVETGFGWADGRNSRKVFSLEPGETLEISDVGDFEGDRGFTCAAWVRLPKDNSGGAIVARMDNTNAHRGWDAWVEGGRV